MRYRLAFRARCGSTPWSHHKLKTTSCSSLKDIFFRTGLPIPSRRLSEDGNFFSNQGIFKNKHSHIVDITSIIFQNNAALGKRAFSDSLLATQNQYSPPLFSCLFLMASIIRSLSISSITGSSSRASNTLIFSASWLESKLLLTDKFTATTMPIRIASPWRSESVVFSIAWPKVCPKLSFLRSPASFSALKHMDFWWTA